MKLIEKEWDKDVKNFRSICIVYNMEDTYRSFYIKEFFKWIGLSYVAVVNKPERNIFDNEEYYEFDIIVNYNQAINKDQCIKIQERTENALVSIDDKEEKEEKELLWELITGIVMNKLDGDKELTAILKELSEIYDKEHMIELLYEYTLILLPKLPESERNRIDEHCTRVADSVADYVKNHTEDLSGREYALYALYYCEKQVNEVRWLERKDLLYDVEKFLEEVNEIYHYDKDYFKVETLKGRVAEFDSRFSASPKFLLENAIRECPIKMCKSYHHYAWGKWKERNHQLFEASVAYQRAYAADVKNYKAMFKLAVEQKNMNENLMAEKFFKDIIAELSDLFIYKEKMSLRELEYLYKAYMLIAKVCEPQFCAGYYKNAEECMDYIRSLLNDLEQENFAVQMYPDPKLRKTIITAMISRLESNLWDCMEYMTGGESDGKIQ